MVMSLMLECAADCSPTTQEHKYLLIASPTCCESVACPICETCAFVELSDSHGDVRGQLARGGEPVTEDFFQRWLKAKGGVDEAEACIRAHAQWRADYIPLGRILEVGPNAHSSHLAYGTRLLLCYAR